MALFTLYESCRETAIEPCISAILEECFCGLPHRGSVTVLVVHDSAHGLIGHECRFSHIRHFTCHQCKDLKDHSWKSRL